MAPSLSTDAVDERQPGHRDRSGVIASARRHTHHVRFFKLGILIGSAAGIGLLFAVTFFDPFSNVPSNVSIASASLSGTKITMELPRLSGFRKDGKPYQVRARSGVQDIRTPKIIELSEVEARIQVESDNSVNVIAPWGIFDSGADLIKMITRTSAETITLKSTSGYTVILKSADVNLKSGDLVSPDKVTVLMPGGSIVADAVQVGDGGKMVTFNGNVKSLFKSADAESTTEAK